MRDRNPQTNVGKPPRGRPQNLSLLAESKRSQQACGATVAKYWRRRAVDGLREIRRIYDLLTSGLTLDRPQYVLDQDVAQRLAETGDDRALCRADCCTPGHLRACVRVAEQRDIAPNLS